MYITPKNDQCVPNLFRISEFLKKSKFEFSRFYSGIKLGGD